MSKDTFYFTHDYNTRNDEKIKALLFKHGLLGYGVFWAIIEDLYNNANALQLDCERIAFELRSDKIIVESVIKDFGLFTFEGSIFGSHSVQKRLEERLSKSTKARESAFKRWNKDSVDANALPPQSEGNAIKEKKVKEIKEKETFERFWNLYDKKVDRKKCETKFKNLKQTDIDKIFETLPSYIARTPDIKFRKDPATYLNNYSWNDEVPIAQDKFKIRIYPTMGGSPIDKMVTQSEYEEEMKSKIQLVTICQTL